MDSIDLKELQLAIADRIYIQIENWNLYLGDAGLAESLAIECKAYLDQGAAMSARKGLEGVKVKLGGGGTSLPLARLVNPGQFFELEEILEPYGR